ncbi:hypothetical protein SAMN02745172_02574 [Pseudoxanthobacter soli DSM 19599]|uniref:Uncharacterized protein n=1 Tax=Pseudoxanthobacter soli DSM 19599 TaxID=1123029 RepID=A0A1M7ZM04_9HYPH|nr:hypothetical protein [Pseudoxanthobacter soli]SHO65925.1 hypothetical protein SAMN02745172_02574 [Pseudoxanthobacter soli DSM 19599]
MKMVRIEKYVQGVTQERFKLPAGIARLVVRLLPTEARAQLRRRGLDVDALLNTATPAGDVQWLDVREDGVEKRICIRIDR